jgi:hypothetical protein
MAPEADEALEQKKGTAGPGLRRDYNMLWNIDGRKTTASADTATVLGAHVRYISIYVLWREGMMLC